ncbi:hypothetical protein AHAS_Ahas14G0186600 [Arachis hypogaea]
MEGNANIIVYHDGENIRNTHEGVSFACENPVCVCGFMHYYNFCGTTIWSLSKHKE